MTPESWQQRLESRGGLHDETWQDDRSDFRILSHPVSLPEEGDYEPDLTVVNLELATQQLYDQEIQVQGLPGFPALYTMAGIRSSHCHCPRSSRSTSSMWMPESSG